MIDVRNPGLLLWAIGLSLFVLFPPVFAFAATEGAAEILDLMGRWAGILLLLGYISNIATHFAVNASLFT